jgi:hypothetical protein
MFGITLVNEVLLWLIEGGANRLLRALGGPDRLPRRNEDFVWY